MVAKRALTGFIALVVGVAALYAVAVGMCTRHSPPCRRAREADEALAGGVEGGKVLLSSPTLGAGERTRMASENECAQRCGSERGFERVTGFVYYTDEIGRDFDEYKRVVHRVCKKPQSIAMLAVSEHDEFETVGVCCCASPVKEIGEHPHYPIVPPKISCDDFCAAGGHGRGVIIGTAPACEGLCHDDCRPRALLLRGGGRRH